MEIFAPLVGVHFRGNEAKELVKTLTPDDGHLLTLEADPDNEYDDHAVKVMYDDMHIGFLARENNREVFDALQNDEILDIKIVSFENTIKPVLLITDSEVKLTAEDMGEYPGDR